MFFIFVSEVLFLINRYFLLQKLEFYKHSSQICDFCSHNFKSTNFFYQYFYRREGSTLFRNSTMVTHCIEASMRIVGYTYLQAVLNSFIDKLKNEKKNCEIDRSRMPVRVTSSVEINSSVDSSSDHSSPSSTALKQNKVSTII